MILWGACRYMHKHIYAHTHVHTVSGFFIWLSSLLFQHHWWEKDFFAFLFLGIAVQRWLESVFIISLANGILRGACRRKRQLAYLWGWVCAWWGGLLQPELMYARGSFYLICTVLGLLMNHTLPSSLFYLSLSWWTCRVIRRRDYWNRLMEHLIRITQGSYFPLWKCPLAHIHHCLE